MLQPKGNNKAWLKQILEKSTCTFPFPFSDLCFCPENIWRDARGTWGVIPAKSLPDQPAPANLVSNFRPMSKPTRHQTSPAQIIRAHLPTSNLVRKIKWLLLFIISNQHALKVVFLLIGSWIWQLLDNGLSLPTSIPASWTSVQDSFINLQADIFFTYFSRPQFSI